MTQEMATPSPAHGQSERSIQPRQSLRPVEERVRKKNSGGQRAGQPEHRISPKIQRSVFHPGSRLQVLQQMNHFRHVGCLEDSITCHQHIGTGFHELCPRFQVDPSVHFEQDIRSTPVNPFA